MHMIHMFAELMIPKQCFTLEEQFGLFGITFGDSCSNRLWFLRFAKLNHFGFNFNWLKQVVVEKYSLKHSHEIYSI